MERPPSLALRVSVGSSKCVILARAKNKTRRFDNPKSKIKNHLNVEPFMTDDSTLSLEIPQPPVTVLSKMQRRVLGVLVEKGITTPEYYPMTLKGLTTGCNQKNNRSPLTEYSEDDVSRTIDELREMGLAAVVHTESGRTERYRHYVRKQFPFTEAQLAVMTELWLRGRQSVGDLRSRASRMHAIDSLDQLRDELMALSAQGCIQANGPLGSRGVEVDHTFYKPSENRTLAPTVALSDDGQDGDVERSGMYRKSASVPLESFSGEKRSAAIVPSEARLQLLEHDVEELRSQNNALRERLQAVEQALAQLSDSTLALRRELGCA